MSKKLIQAAAGNAGDTLGYVDDVFSTYLYEGNGSSVTVNNGIDLAGEGGMVWVKNRTSTPSHAIYDTERGPSTGTSSSTNKTLSSNASSPEGIFANVAGITAFNSNGFTTASDQVSPYNVTGPSSQRFASWTFRKQEGFFDVRTVTHTSGTDTVVDFSNLGTIGAVISKKTTATESWWVSHRYDNTKYLVLNTTAGEATVAGNFGISGTNFTIQSGLSSGDYVIYAFAHDVQSFGDNGNESIIKCGSYTGNASTNGPEINLGWEPQWILVKKSSASGNNWFIFDSMRGITTGSDDLLIRPNLSDSEGSAEYASLLATGFKVKGTDQAFNSNGSTYIYIAIRRPMKTPTAATEVFKPTAYTGTEPTPQYFTTGFTVDANIYKYRNSNIGATISDRLRGGPIYSFTSDTTAEGDLTGNSASAVFNLQFQRNDGFSVGSGAANASGNLIAYSFKRAPKFCDVVAYSGDGNATQDINHSLGVSANMIILKQRKNSGTQWLQWNSETPNHSMYFNLTNANFQTGGGQPYYVGQSVSSTAFRVSADGSVNQSNGSGNSYIAYLFATLAGVSKVGSYTGTGSNVDVNCGFSSGARFILIKRTDSTGDWYIWDSARGIVSGNDPYYLSNSTAAEVTGTDYIDPLSSGFTVTSSAPAGLNASGGTYIFLAIA